MKKQIKMYLHHSHYEPVSYKKRTGVFGVFANTIIEICYIVGFVLLQITFLPYYFYKAIVNMPSHIISLTQKIQTRRFQRTIAAFTLLTIVAGASVQGLILIAKGQNIKGQVLGASDAGLGYLQDAKTSLDAQNTAAAQANFSKALEQFRTSKETLHSTGITLRSILSVVPQKQDADSMLAAAELITQAGIKGTELFEITNSMKISAIGLNSGSNNHEMLQRLQSLLNESVDLANQAAEKINSVSINSIPETYRPSFVTARDVSTLFQNNVSSLKEVCSLLFDIVLGQKNVLLVFQNNNELRANGGFMGTIGTAKLYDGALDSLDIRSVYDWDGQLKEKILPPQPLYLVNDHWYLRDSNWFANFPDSASRISALYEKEGGETPDLIVAMTPDVILDMLDRTGPITLPQHNITLTKENFIEETQVATSVNYDKTLNQPKQFLADFFPILMEKVGSGDGGIMTFLEIFQKNLYKKNVLLYARNADIQKKIASFNWGGELKTTDRDYLSIVSSNLGGTKTDLNMYRATAIDSSIAPADGTITNKITYTVKNLSFNAALNNKSFIRFYVPKDSTLTASEGFSNDIVLPRIPAEDYTLDAEVQAWQQNVSQDTVSGTFKGTEAGKTWFGNYLDVPAGETKTVTITYTLPFKTGHTDRHSMLIQKQPGSVVGPVTYTLHFDGRNSLWKSNSAYVSEDATLTYSQDLIADTFIGTVLEKQ